MTRASGVSAVLASLALGAAFALTGVAAGAMADEVEYGDDEVTVTVLIDQFDPCAVGAPGCTNGVEGSLANTGAALGATLGAGVLFAAFGAGVLFAAFGAGTYALAARRRAARSLT